MILRSASGVCSTVASPSAQPAAHPAVSGLTAAARRGGGCSGRVHRRARSTVTWPSWLTSFPDSSERMTAVLSSRRSEEHTSELQSRPHLVCRLLLEKKKKTKYIKHMLAVL